MSLFQKIIDILYAKFGSGTKALPAPVSEPEPESLIPDPPRISNDTDEYFQQEEDYVCDRCQTYSDLNVKETFIAVTKDGAQVSVELNASHHYGGREQTGLEMIRRLEESLKIVAARITTQQLTSNKIPHAFLKDWCNLTNRDLYSYSRFSYADFSAKIKIITPPPVQTSCARMSFFKILRDMYDLQKTHAVFTHTYVTSHEFVSRQITKLFNQRDLLSKHIPNLQSQTELLKKIGDATTMEAMLAQSKQQHVKIEQTLTECFTRMALAHGTCVLGASGTGANDASEKMLQEITELATIASQALHEVEMLTSDSNSTALRTA